MFEVGDIVADRRFGYVLKVFRVDGDWVTAIYECNPTTFKRFKPVDLRLLSKTKGVDMSVWNSGEFSETIKRQLEWAKGVHRMPKKYKESKPRGERKASSSAPRLTKEDLNKMSLEELEALLTKMEGK